MNQLMTGAISPCSSSYPFVSTIYMLSIISIATIPDKEEYPMPQQPILN